MHYLIFISFAGNQKNKILKTHSKRQKLATTSKMNYHKSIEAHSLIRTMQQINYNFYKFNLRRTLKLPQLY